MASFRSTLILALAAALLAPASSGEVLYAAEDNRVRRFDLDTLDAGSPRDDVLIENAGLDAERGRDVNGMFCRLPDGSDRFVAGEDSHQPHPPAGWGVFEADGTQVGKLTATAEVPMPEPYGCAFDARGRLFTTETGRQMFGHANGQLILWFAPFDRFPGPPGTYPESDATSDHYCKIATDLGTPTGIAIDAAGRVYVAEASGRRVVRFSPPFPTSADPAGGCGARDALGSPRATRVQRETFVDARWLKGLVTYSGLAFAPNGNLYVASVLTGRIGEFDLEGELVRMVLVPPEWLPPFSTGHPQGLAVDARGTLYYADLDLRLGLRGVRPGPDGKVRRIRFDAGGRPGPPEVIRAGLAFPDGLGVFPGGL